MASAENTRTPTSKAPKRSRTSGWVFILCPLHTSNTNIHTLRLCVSFKYASFYRAVSNRSSRCLDRCFCSFRSQNSIDYKTLEHWSSIILYLKLFICCLFWLPWVALKGPLIYISICIWTLPIRSTLRLFHYLEKKQVHFLSPARATIFACESYK